MNQNTKIALGGGGFCLYAPRFPRFQLTPGFADECLIFNAQMPRMFVLSLLKGGVPVTLSPVKHEMKNGCLDVDYVTADKTLKVTEHRFVSSDDRFVSVLTVENSSKENREFDIVMWTTTDVEGEPVSHEGDSFRLRRQIQTHDFPPVPIEIVYSNPDSKGARCLQAFFAEGNSGRPDYEETPWYDRAALPVPRAKKPMVKPSPILPSAHCYCGVFRTVTVEAGKSVTHRFEANVLFKGKGLNYRPRRPDPKDENSHGSFMDRAPRFSCDDKAAEAVVRGRLEALHLLRMPGGVGSLSHPSVAEGNGVFHEPIAFSAPAILREVRWLADATLGRGILRLFFDNLRQNGMVPGRVYMTSMTGTDFYHADWGGGFESFDDVHPDRNLKRQVIMGMQRYTKWLANNRDPEGSGLTDVCNHFEAGQEFSRLYTIIDEKADRAEEFTEQFRLKGIDVSVMRYRMVKFLSRVADEIQEKAMANRFIAASEVIQDTIRKKMWDENAGIFMDMDPKTRRRTGVKAAVGFYPLATDIPTPKQVDALLATLGDRKEFWTKYPVPSLAISDPFFDADGQWKGTRRHCPWNGRVWPMINSHVIEGLCYHAERGNKVAGKLLKELMKKTVEMASGEPDGVHGSRVFEHYHPLNGRSSRYRGVDWYMHAFLMDNIFRVLCGFVIRFGQIQDDPVIDDMPDFKLAGVPLGNKLFHVERKHGKLKITSD
ncbi:MAG: hypothetical protein HZB39_18835 [Planctomycetes bacterium]|nr:hypothetical protein [Planctomycetota bacterium]